MHGEAESTGFNGWENVKRRGMVLSVGRQAVDPDLGIPERQARWGGLAATQGHSEACGLDRPDGGGASRVHLRKAAVHPTQGKRGQERG